MTTDGKEDKDSAGTEENEDECLVLERIQGEESLAAPPATTQTPTSTTRISSRRGDQTTTGKGGKGNKKWGDKKDKKGGGNDQCGKTTYVIVDGGKDLVFMVLKSWKR